MLFGVEECWIRYCWQMHSGRVTLTLMIYLAKAIVVYDVADPRPGHVPGDHWERTYRGHDHIDPLNLCLEGPPAYFGYQSCGFRVDPAKCHHGCSAGRVGLVLSVLKPRGPCDRSHRGVYEHRRQPYQRLSDKSISTQCLFLFLFFEFLRRELHAVPFLASTLVFWPQGALWVRPGDCLEHLIAISIGPCRKEPCLCPKIQSVESEEI